MGCWGDTEYGQTNVPEYVQGGYPGLNAKADLENISGADDPAGVKIVIVSLVTGQMLSGGVDTEGELHLWGRNEHAVVPEK